MAALQVYIHAACAGIYHHAYDKSLNIKNGFPVFSTVIEAHHVGKQYDDFAAFKLTDEDKEAMHKLSKLPDIGAHIACCRRPMAQAQAWDAAASKMSSLLGACGGCSTKQVCYACSWL